MRWVAWKYKHECDSRATRAAVDFESESYGPTGTGFKSDHAAFGRRQRARSNARVQIRRRTSG
ncbi:hypothetical protein BDM02DRAFT_3112799 [Thelephora ganbajun]|uniref:Uncharacterized protein n=1 Tax=Thelephora ganbajun TaxID=370292 RepID=A0ACB6ZK98_THEGA|nr:hypothetical protein BDM02DRAFT_3112799 [Thelephora ganbajun]